MAHDWKEQWRRVEIGLRRVQNLYAGVQQGSSEDAMYDLYAFFLNCWHFRDWLTSPEPPTLAYEKSVKPRIKTSKPLRVCGDVANRTKHFRLTQTVYSDPDTRVSSASVNVNAPAAGVVVGQPDHGPAFVPAVGRQGTVQYSWVIQSGDESYDALRLAEDCTEEWRRLLREHRLM